MKQIRNQIFIENKNIPYKWGENLVAEGKIGGVMLVFLEGKNKKEINEKVKAIKKFSKEFKGEGTK